MMRRTWLLWTLMLLVGAAWAQELRITRMRTMPAGKSPDGKDMVSLVTDAGETVSKSGVVVPYELFLSGGKPGGFRFERTPLMSLKDGDQIRMYVTGLEPEPFGGDPTSEAGGVWKLVTVAGFKEGGGSRVTLEIREPLKRKDGSSTTEIAFRTKDKFLESEGAPVSETDATAPASPARAWSLSDVPLWGWLGLLLVAVVGIMAVVRLRR